MYNDHSVELGPNKKYLLWEIQKPTRDFSNLADLCLIHQPYPDTNFRSCYLVSYTGVSCLWSQVTQQLTIQKGFRKKIFQFYKQKKTWNFFNKISIRRKKKRKRFCSQEAKIKFAQPSPPLFILGSCQCRKWAATLIILTEVLGIFLSPNRKVCRQYFQTCQHHYLVCNFQFFTHNWPAIRCYRPVFLNLCETAAR